MEMIQKQVNYKKPKLPAFVAVILYLTVFFYLTFPKAGIKIEGIPVTVSDLLFMLLMLFCLTKITYWRETFNQFKVVIALLISSLFYILLKLGYSYWHYDLLRVGTIVPLLIYPAILLILLLFYCHYDIQWKKLLLLPVAAFVILSFYALLQYFLGVENVMVPGLTYNWTDAQNPQILMTKKNFYGYYTKIFSTYQNGNIFGVNLLLIFPLVFELLYRRRKILGYIALAFFITVAFLSASRAVWAGVIFYVFIRFFLLKRGWGKLLVVFPLSLISALLLFFESLRFRANLFLGKDVIPELIKLPALDKTVKLAGGGGETWAKTNIVTEPQITDLAGREGGLYKLWDATFGALNWEAIFIGPYGLLPRGSYGISGEMVYMTLFAYLGLIGLILWSLPILFTLYNFFKLRNDFILQGILLGLVSYFIVASIEGAYWLSPTAFNLWFIIGIGWIRWHYLKATNGA